MQASSAVGGYRGMIHSVPWKKEFHLSLLENLLCYKTLTFKDLDAFYPTELKKFNCFSNKSVNNFLKRELIISKQSETLIIFSHWFEDKDGITEAHLLQHVSDALEFNYQQAPQIRLLLAGATHDSI